MPTSFPNINKNVNPRKTPYSEPTLFGNFKYDIPAGLVVFLVALPLCLGIAVASDAPPFSGVLAGILGGLVVPLISRSAMGVSGPAAGLTAIVVLGIADTGSFELFLLAVFLGGLVQLLLFFMQAGTIAYFLPSSVLKGMLAGIGMILILKQLPHAFGYDVEAFSEDEFWIWGTDQNAITMILAALKKAPKNLNAIIISIGSLFFLIVWDRIPFLKKLSFLPAALMAVLVGTLINELYIYLNLSSSIFSPLASSHLVNLPITESLKNLQTESNASTVEFISLSISSFWQQLTFPDFSLWLTHIKDWDIWVLAFTIGIVASIASLLTVEAVDKLEPYKRNSPLNRELLAQGVANTIAGLIGAIPITAVIVRSTASISAGGRTRMAAIIHGLLLLVSVIFISQYLNHIPLASLAAILLVVGYKLIKPSTVKEIYRKGREQFVPFIVTAVVIVFSDLLIGILVGIAVGFFFVIRANVKTAISIKQVGRDENQFEIIFNKDLSFVNRAFLRDIFARIPNHTTVVVNGTRANFIDKDIEETIKDFMKGAEQHNIQVTLKNVAFTSSEEAIKEHEKNNTNDEFFEEPESSLQSKK
ncbi:SulP family inorganic anion transporter [Bernardetia sp. OM2101]|uniref:SulP family inorganic anion transporter n=1 Tax=Bernardetia sp. OM2101 TaxID=3344876 RepID=UPI0035CEBA6D